MDIQIERKKGLRILFAKRSLPYWGGMLFLLFAAWLLLRDNASTLRVDAGTLSVAEVTQGDFNDYIRVTGQVEPITTVQLSPLEAGVVERLVVEEGASVRRGDVLVELSNPSLTLEILNSEAELAEKQNLLRNTLISMEQEKLTLRQNKACMGISLLFSDVTKLYVGYRQAEAASNIGKRRDTDGTAYFYSKYYLEDMLEHYADTMPLEDTYTHYLDRLMDDNNSVCSNIKLLYYFLCSERNISLTAKHVHMHRNSVIYRIQKIQDILALDLDDPDVRLRLMISFKILEMTGRIPHWETPHGENDAGNSGIVHQE